MQYELISQECFAEKLILSIRVEINFNYMDLPEVQSSYSETTDAVFSFHANAWVLTDLYTRDDYYDAAVRGFADDYIALVSSGGLYLPTDIRARQMQALVNTQLKAFSEKTNFPVKNSKASLCNVEIPSSTLLAASPIALNKAAIVSYAKSNAKKNPPARGTSGVPYYDFSQISGAWDCTNFVSHALLAGGAPQYDPGTSGITSTTYWYYRSTSNRSSSWAGVNELYSFLTNGSTVKGPKGQSISYAPYSTPTFVAGDILQCYSSSYGGWRHSTIITGTYPISSSLTGALITGRSGGSSGDVDMKAADKYPNESKRVIKVFGYYN
jgi:hypothetical protein